MRKTTHRWTRLASAKWEDAWQERLRFLGPHATAFITWPDSRALKIEAYCDARTAADLVKNFGGRATKISPTVWSGVITAPRAPLSIRGKLKIFSDTESWKSWGDRRPRGLLIPSGMAFGTGEHATTASCLRMLCDELPRLPENFSAADLGCGSGILALAAKALGAGAVEAIDNDPAAIRTSKENARLNQLRGLNIRRASVLDWTPALHPDIVLANLYSELLMAAAPLISAALVPGSPLVFSGVLNRQAREVTASLEKNHLSIERIVRRGKWCAGLARRVSH
ncbi:MAG: hypothetical protein Fur0032_21460 [Terrimicrobiaceae bacterium]